MSAYTEFFLNSRSDVVQLELLEISHPNFTQTFRVVRNAVDGVTVTLEDLSVQNFEYYPLKIDGNSPRGDLDFTINVSFGDLGEVLPPEIDAVTAANGFGVKPVVKYRTYSSTDLTTPLFGPVVLEIESFSFNREGASFSAKAPSLNNTSTGELYKIDRFPMLRGFL
jgi:hypothetical protein